MRPPPEYWNRVALRRDLISWADATVGIQVSVNDGSGLLQCIFAALPSHFARHPFPF
jgi:hypothetical protein